MGRRKKEAPEAHREKIAAAAERLFLAKGVEASTMDEVAKEAGYSKATLYVYFKNKEELVSVLALESMKKLYGSLKTALEHEADIKTKYNSICGGLVRYQREFPFYFKTALGEIGTNPQGSAEADHESFQVGEEINGLLAGFIEEGIRAGAFRENIEVLPTVFAFWGMLSGLILTAAEKETYIAGKMKLSREEFLRFGFDTLYRSVEKR